MNYTYRIRKDKIFDENNIPYTVYGIEAYDLSGRLLESISDIVFDRNEMEAFINCCNAKEISLLHLLENIEDLIG